MQASVAIALGQAPDTRGLIIIKMGGCSVWNFRLHLLYQDDRIKRLPESASVIPVRLTPPEISENRMKLCVGYVRNIVRKQ
jgi:hypothetical protein